MLVGAFVVAVGAREGATVVGALVGATVVGAAVVGAVVGAAVVGAEVWVYQGQISVAVIIWLVEEPLAGTCNALEALDEESALMFVVEVGHDSAVCQNWTKSVAWIAEPAKESTSSWSALANTEDGFTVKSVTTSLMPEKSTTSELTFFAQRRKPFWVGTVTRPKLKFLVMEPDTTARSVAVKTMALDWVVE